MYGCRDFPPVSAALKALRITRFGDPSVLRVETVADPVLKPGQALVRIHAAGVNRADIMQREGRYPPPADAPADIPGLEFAGEIRSLAGPSARLAVGQRVFGLCSGGAQAEYIAVDCDLLVPTPSNIDDTEAGGIAEAYITAHDALITQARLRPGERVLVHAVGSGVGIAALHIASSLGCEVFGTSRTAWKLERAAALGLAHPIDTGSVDFAEAIMRLSRQAGIDVVIDFVGAPYFERNLAVLSQRGRMVCLATLGGTQATLALAQLMRKRLHLMGSMLRSRSLKEKIEATQAFERDVVPALAARELRLPIDKVFPLAQAAEAHRYVESDANFGKVVFEI